MKRPLYLVVTPFFPSPKSWRGPFCYDFVKALMRTKKYDVRVFIPGCGEDYDYQNVHVHRFPIRMLPSGLLPFLFMKQNVASFIRKVLGCNIDIHNVAVCHAHTGVNGCYALAVKKLNPSCITLLHHHDPASFGLRLLRVGLIWINRFFAYFSIKRMHERIDIHVFISKIVEKSFRMAPRTDWTTYLPYQRVGRGVSFLHPAKIKRGILLHNGVDCVQFNSQGRRVNDDFVMGCIANFVDWKDQFSLLQAILRVKEQLGNWKLRLIGTGPLFARCKAYVREHNLEAYVSFEKEVDHTQLPDFYRGLDLFVLPSYFEGFGCVFTEAWACGTPFITCEGQGMDDLILPEERELWLCKPKNPQDLAEKILHFYLHRPEQHLSGPIDIDVLVPQFVETLEGI